MQINLIINHPETDCSLQSEAEIRHGLRYRHFTKEEKKAIKDKILNEVINMHSRINFEERVALEFQSIQLRLHIFKLKNAGYFN